MTAYHTDQHASYKNREVGPCCECSDVGLSGLVGRRDGRAGLDQRGGLQVDGLDATEDR